MEDLIETTETLVEAIEDGKIISVTEKYAKREGLPILRKPRIIQLKENLSKNPDRKMEKYEEQRRLANDISRRPLNWRNNQIFDELIENFHWEIAKARRTRGLTKRQLAELIGEKEETIKLLEYGSIVVKDFIIINKVQNVLGINLRKDKVDLKKSMHEIIETGTQEGSNAEEFKSSDVQIFED